MNEMNRNGVHLLYLISCAIRQKDADDKVLEGIDLKGLFALAKMHSVSTMVCMVLEQSELFINADPEMKKQWLESKHMAIRKNMLLDAEHELLMKELAEAGIWYMPLKGSILKDWYPKYGMREMADHDILFDISKREQVRELFLKHGYNVDLYNISNHDIYEKPPVYNFEMHASLFAPGEYKDLAAKYAGVKEILIRDEQCPYRYHFKPEDFYVYVVVHAYKHYSWSGTGIRALADLYVMNRKIGNSLDRRYVESELDSLGIAEYERSSRLLAEKVFGSDCPVTELDLTEEELSMLRYYLGSSTYGSTENRVNNHLHSIQTDSGAIHFHTKLRYCQERLFPGWNWCEDRYPFVYKHPWLLPAFWIWRFIKKVPAGAGRIRQELRTLKDVK